MSSAEQISELLLRWEEQCEQGQEPAPQELCADCPELVPELTRRIAALKAMYRVPNGVAQVTAALEQAPSQSPRLSELPQLEAYEVLEPLGSGGMGKVYKAFQPALKRLVALKMILHGTHATPQEAERFRVEAEAVARLQHPNIVQIYDIGSQNGCPYLALEYVAGGSLAERLNGKPLPPQLAAQLLRTLALAMSFAHQRQIVHRDLKPANILLAGGRDTPLAQCLPKIADFGLAKRLDESLAHTRTGSVMGTPTYMAPEQAEGRTRQIGPATDIYALGVLLYEMLTGKPPFQAASLLETLELVRTEEPRPPRLDHPAIPVDLETICLKCLQKEPALRYATAQALADDLGRFLEGEPIQARSPTIVDRLAWTLNRVKDVPDLKPASWILRLLLPLPFFTQLLALLAFDQPYYPGVAMAVLAGTLVVTIGLYLLLSGEGLRIPLTATTRHLWSMRVSLLLSVLLLPLVSYGSKPPDQAWNPLTVFPLWSVLFGSMFFSLGGLYWGRLYLLGLSFMGLALLMLLRLEWAPVALSLLFSVTMLVLLRQVERINATRASQEADTPPRQPFS